MMQDQQDLKPPQSTTTSLGEIESYSEEHVDNLSLEELDNDAELSDVGHQQNLEQLYEQDISDKENMYPPNYQNEIEECDDKLAFEEREHFEELDVSEKDFIEETEDHTPEEEAKQDTIVQSPNFPYNEPAKPYNSLLLVQEFHTGLTSGDDSGESEDEEEEEEEEEDNEQEQVPDEQLIHTQSKAMEPQQHVHVPSRPMDLDFIALKTFRPDATKEENIERNKNLRKYGLLFTRDEYRYYIENPIVNPPEDEEYYQEVQDILASIAEKEKKWEASLGDKRKQNQVEEPAPKRKRSESPVTGSPSEDFTEIVPDSKMSEPSIKSKPLLTSEAESPTPPLSAISKPNIKPNPQSAVLDTVLTNLLRDSQSAQKSKTGEPSDLEAAAMAAGLDWNTNDTTKSGPQSKLSKQEHIEFLRYNDILKSGKELTLQDKIKFDKLCSIVKSEKEHFLRHQCKSVLGSGVYNTLDPKVEKLVKELYELEKKRVHAYPQFYKYFNVVEMSPNPTSEAPILAFKKCLFTQGQIAPCNPKMYNSSRNMNLFRKYLVNNANSPDEEEEHIQYYKKKLLPAIVVDPIIPNLIKDTRPDVVVSSECLTAMVEMIHSISSDICIPITVMKAGGDKKVLVLDRPFPKDTLTARQKNKLVYDLAFKSLCLDWKNKHTISTNQSRPPSPNNYGAAAADETNDDWNNELDENLQYNLWSFGDMNIIIRHQADGDLVGVGPKERRVCLTTKLDYQIQPDGFEEIVTPSERASQWIQSYIGGHAFVLEGRIDVTKNRLVRVDQKQMKDIMSDNWKPSYESEMLRHTFLRLQKMLVPGNYLLQHKAGDRNFLIYQGTDKLENASSGVDIYSKYDSSTLPTVSNPELAFVPAWNLKNSSTEQIPWTFPASQ